MPLPEILKKKVDKSLTEFCQNRIPPRVRDKIRLEIEYRGNTTTLVERRPVWNDPDAEWTKSKVAQFRFDSSRITWSLAL